MKKQYLFTLIVLAIIISSGTTAQTIRYIKENATGTGDGSSWENASNDLQEIINISEEGDEIWVAEGVYKPTKKIANADLDGMPTTDRDKSFVLKTDVKLYGGFIGIESLISDRDWEINKTILSGDIGIIEDSIDNCYHVIISSGDMGSACLDGFIITEGNSSNVINDNRIYVNGNYVVRSAGSGIANYENSSFTIENVIVTKNTAIRGGGIYNQNSSPLLANVIVSDNCATSGNGGGIYNFKSSPILKKTTIINNVSSNDGGGIYNQNNSSPILINVTINNNRAFVCGGGVYNIESSPELINVIISGNMALNAGGGGGICNEKSSPILTNVVISNNMADYYGGGIYNYDNSRPILTNVTICNNSATAKGGGIFNYGSSPKIRNSIIWGNTLLDETSNNIDNEDAAIPIFGYCLVEGEDIGSGIILNSNPLFVDADNENYYLTKDSPCREIGSIYYYNVDSVPDLSDIITDIDDNPRFTDGKIDLGAYQGTYNSIDIINTYNINIYPNPVSDILYLESPLAIEQVSIYDINGKHQKQVERNQNSISIKDLANGIYIVKIKLQNGDIINKKVIKTID